MNNLRMIPGLPAFELHRDGGGCMLYAFAGGAWHSWDLPCNAAGHRLAVDEDVRAEIAKHGRPYLVSPLPLIDRTVCKHCGQRYGPLYGGMACGAMPSCPHCGKIQGGAWEQGSGSYVSSG